MEHSIHPSIKRPIQPLKQPSSWPAINPSRHDTIHPSAYQTAYLAPQTSIHQSAHESSNLPVPTFFCISIIQLATACECYSRYVDLLAGVGHHLKAFTVQHLEAVAFARWLVDAEALDVEGQEPSVAHGKLSPHREVRHQQFAGWFLVRYCNRHRLASDTLSPDTLSPDTLSPDTLSPGSLCTLSTTITLKGQPLLTLQKGQQASI